MAEQPYLTPDGPERLAAIRQQKPIAVIEKLGKRLQVTLPGPFPADQRDFLQQSRHIPQWTGTYWRCPKSWFNRLVEAILQRYGQVYVIQKVSGEKCAPSCWASKKLDCTCACGGARHGSGQPEGNWYVVSEACAIRLDDKRVSARLLSKK